MQNTINKPSTELTLPQRAAVALGAAKHEIELRELVKASASIVSVTNPDGREQAHRAAMTLRNARTGIAATGKAAREDATAFSKAVIAEEKRLIEIIEPEEERVFLLRDAFDAKVAAERQAKIDAERARVDEIKRMIDDIRMSVAEAAGKSAAHIKSELTGLASLVPGELFQEFQAEASRVRDESIDRLTGFLALQEAKEAEEVRQKAEREAEAARMAAERAAIERERAELAERAAEQERIAKAAQAEADRVRKLEDEARQHRMNVERDALLAERATLRLQQEKLDAAQADLARTAETDRLRLQAIADQALSDARQPAEMPLSITTEPDDAAAVEHFKTIVAELLIERTGDEVRALLEEVLCFTVEA